MSHDQFSIVDTRPNPDTRRWDAVIPRWVVVSILAAALLLLLIVGLFFVKVVSELVREAIIKR